MPLLYPRVLFQNSVNQETRTWQSGPETLRTVLSLASTHLFIKVYAASSVALGLETSKTLASHQGLCFQKSQQREVQKQFAFPGAKNNQKEKQNPIKTLRPSSLSINRGHAAAGGQRGGDSPQEGRGKRKRKEKGLTTPAAKIT